MHTKEGPWEDTEKAVNCKPRREVSEETRAVNTLILDLRVVRK